MKPVLILSALLFVVTCNAEFQPGVIYYPDGASKSGFIEFNKNIFSLPIYNSDRFISFKSNETDEPEKIESDDLYKIEYKSEKGLATYYRLYIWSGNAEISKKPKEKSWLYQYSRDSKIAFVGYQKVAATDEGIYYFIHYPGSDYAKYLWWDAYEPGSKKQMLKNIKTCFSELCPAVVTASETDVFKKKKASEIIQYYFEHCAEKIAK